MNTTQTETRELAAISSNPIDAGRMSAGSLMLNVPVMESLMRVADLMASGTSTVPKHLQGNPGDCMAICMQSMQWGMNPFAVAQKTHIVNGRLGYEAQLVNAVLQATGAIEGDFSYEFKGDGPNMECRVGAVPQGRSEITWNEWLKLSTVTTRNSPLWVTNPKQQIGYLQVKNWGRAYKPAALLGVNTPDELELIPPKNMGPVQHVPAAPGVLKDAEVAARAGVASYSEFWKNAGATKRKEIGSVEHDRLKLVAVDADKSRTVETKTPKTFDQIMATLCGALSEDDLYAASNLINLIESAEEQVLLNAKFDERIEELRGIV